MMRRLFILLLILSLQCSSVQAITVPVSRVQNALSGVIQAKMSSRGFAANDPRWTATLISNSNIAAFEIGSAATVALLGVTAPAWITVLAALAVGTTAMIAVNEGLKWIFKDTGDVQIGDNPASVNTPAGLAPPTIIYCGNGYVCSPSESIACSGQGSSNLGNYTITWVFDASYDGYCSAVYTYTTGRVVTNPKSATLTKTTTNKTICPGINLTASGGVCPASNFPEPSPAPVKTISDAVNALTPAELAEPLSPQIIADTANDLWKTAAASTGYDGLPYDATDPITASDAAKWQSANSSNWPTVSDFVSPQAAPSGGTASTPFSLPTASTPVSTEDTSATPSTGTNPSSSVLENLGPDPGIGSPSLEATPTAQQILAPLMNLFPTLRNFAMPSHSATCPTWTVHLFNQDITAQGQCTMLDQARPIASTTMALVWTLVALFIVLAA